MIGPIKVRADNKGIIDGLWKGELSASSRKLLTASLWQGMRGQKLFQIFRPEETEVYIDSLARWVTQLKGLAEPSDRQEVLAVFMEDKIRVHSIKRPKGTTKRSFEVLKELQEKKSKKALVLVQKRQHIS